MFKKVSTLLLVAVFAFSAIGNAAVKGEKKWKEAPKGSEVMSTETPAVSVKLAKSVPTTVRVTATPADGIEIGNTDYDYGWNSGSSRGVATFNNGAQVHMVYNDRDLDAGAAPLNRRGNKYVFFDAANPTALVKAFPRPLATGATGFGGVDVIPAGAGAGIAVTAYHTPLFFAIDGSPGGGSFTESAIPAPLNEGGLDPEISVTKDGNTLWYSHTKNRTDYYVFKSTDFGASWTQPDTLISHYTPIFAGATGANDNPVLTAANGDLYMVTTLAGTGAVAPLGSAHPDSADRAGYFKSTNGGTSWTWTTLAKDGDPLVVAAGDTVYLLLENFSGTDGVVDGSNNLHVVANGYSLKVINDSTTSNRFYTLYWKTGMSGWKIISDKAVGNLAEYDSAYYLYNGNAFGHAYPTIGVKGNNVFAAWSQTRFNAGKMDTAAAGVQYDLWWTNSIDGGASWSNVTKLANSTGALFATVGEELAVNGANITASLVYYADTARGSTVFDGLASVQIPVIFRTITWTGSSVGEQGVVANSYELGQNFPNPFNPSTSINYTLGKAENVSLKVYNMLGQEVATVVNGLQNAGPHSVRFDASNLASGMYLYKLQTGSFSDVKKMMLLK
ncbi:MAG: T9SS type A sorting domain-containing protein [Bacteroidetes bacterium]|nr:MAG: T9SS type A sorting domain-containing protein [Bacteroidota bacterium]